MSNEQKAIRIQFGNKRRVTHPFLLLLIPLLFPIYRGGFIVSTAPFYGWIFEGFIFFTQIMYI